jgi:DNA-binding response OmpR family regulator
MVRALPCILVVEDEPAVRDLIVAFLKAGGYRNVVCAGNAEEALFYVFKDAGLNIQCALVDLVLPNASGLAVIRRIRAAKSPRRRAIPIIVLTGRTDADTYKAAMRRGANGYLMKPVSPALVVDTVNKILSERGIVPPTPLKPLNQPGIGEQVAPLDTSPPTLDDTPEKASA